METPLVFINNNAVQIIPANTMAHLETIEKLAWEIIPEFYAPYIPPEQCIFFVKKFQTVEAMIEQIANGFEYYLLLQSANCAGYLGLKPEPGKIHLSKLYLLKQFRGLGIGSVAMEFTNERAIKCGARSIELCVNSQNADTISFYEHRGFAITEPLLQHYENGHSVKDYRMIKYL